MAVRARCERCGARLVSRGEPCPGCGLAPLDIQVEDWASSQWSLAAAEPVDAQARAAGAAPSASASAAGASGTANPGSSVTVDTGHRGMIVALGIVALLVGAGFVLSLGGESDGAGDDVAVPESTLEVPTTLPESTREAPTTSSAVPSTSVPLGIEPPPVRPELPPLPEFVVPRFLPITVYLTQGVTRMGFPERGARLASVDLDTGRVTEIGQGTLFPGGYGANDVLLPGIQAVHDTEAGPLVVVRDEVRYETVMRPLDGDLESEVRVEDRLVVLPDGSAWTFVPTLSELHRYVYGSSEAVDVRPVPPGMSVWVIGVDAQGDPVLRAVDGRSYAARPDGTFEQVTDALLLAVRGNLEVFTACDAALACSTVVRTPAWERDLGVVADWANVSPTGDAAVVITGGATFLVGRDGELTRLQATYGGGNEAWSADGAFFATVVDPTTFVVWEVEAQGLTWVQMSSDWGINQLVGLTRQPPR